MKNQLPEVISEVTINLTPKELTPSLSLPLVPLISPPPISLPLSPTLLPSPPPSPILRSLSPISLLLPPFLPLIPMIQQEPAKKDKPTENKQSVMWWIGGLALTFLSIFSYQPSNLFISDRRPWRNL